MPEIQVRYRMTDDGPEPRSGYDAIVIGAGINGAAIARELALRGARVLVLEQDDAGGGTTSASTRLIHGGLRYLEHLELSLVRESLREREALLATAPHLVEPLGIVLPFFAGARRSRWQIRLGLWLYELLARSRRLPAHEVVDAAELARRLPGLCRDGLLGGACYFDAQVRYPERLVIELLLDATAAGAVLATHTAATSVAVEQGAVIGVDWRSAGGSGRARAGTVINAAGPWVDRVLGTLEPGRLIGGTKGSHVVTRPFEGAPATAVYAEAASDGRPFFVIPWNGLYLIGTTEQPFDGDPAEARLSAEERSYLLAETRRLFPAAGDLDGTVLYSYAGVRPLPYQPGRDASAVTRRHLIHAHDGARGLYSIIGGKLTTHRALAEDVVGRLHDRLGLRREPGLTGRRMLPGGLDDADRDALLAELGGRFGAPQAGRLWRIYGGRAAAIAALIEQTPELGQALDGGSPGAATGGVLVAELVHALEREWAVTLTDIIQRRCMAGLGPDFGLMAAAAASRRLAELGIWTREEADAQHAAYREHARACGAVPATGTGRV